MSVPTKCNQCIAAMINGVFCHETGCPNSRKVWDADEEEWVVEREEPDDDDIDYDASTARERNELSGREDRDR